MPTDQVINRDANGIPVHLRVLRIGGGLNPQTGRFARGLRPVDSRVDAFLTTAKTVERTGSVVRRIGTNWPEKREEAISPTPSGLSGNPERGSGFSSLEERESRGGGIPWLPKARWRGEARARLRSPVSPLHPAVLVACTAAKR